MASLSPSPHIHVRALVGANRLNVCSRILLLALYQLALVTPGTSPRIMISRNFERDSPNLR